MFIFTYFWICHGCLSVPLQYPWYWPKSLTRYKMARDTFCLANFSKLVRNVSRELHFVMLTSVCYLFFDLVPVSSHGFHNHFCLGTCHSYLSLTSFLFACCLYFMIFKSIIERIFSCLFICVLFKYYSVSQHLVIEPLWISSTVFSVFEFNATNVDFWLQKAGIGKHLIFFMMAFWT